MYLQIHEMETVVMINKRIWPCWINVYLHQIIEATARKGSISVPMIEREGYVLFNFLGVYNHIWRQQTIATDILEKYKILIISISSNVDSLCNVTYRIRFWPDSKLQIALIYRHWDIHLRTGHLLSCHCTMILDSQSFLVNSLSLIYYCILSPHWFIIYHYFICTLFSVPSGKEVVTR